MPELPEVETVRRNLAQSVLKKSIEHVDLFGPRTVRRHDPAVVVSVLQGAAFVEARRHGKYLGLDLDNGFSLGMHLRMSGQLRVHGQGDPVAPHTHARIHFDDGTELRFIDPRTFGELWVCDVDDALSDSLGPDALTALPTPDELRNALIGRRVAIKTLLLDQSVLAGLGNIYADEVLWQARVKNTALPSQLSKPAFKRLVDAIELVLGRAVSTGGSTLADAQYVDVFGNAGTAQTHHAVYAREGKPCLRCGTPIGRRVVGGRSSFSCRRCQR